MAKLSSIETILKAGLGINIINNTISNSGVRTINNTVPDSNGNINISSTGGTVVSYTSGNGISIDSNTKTISNTGVLSLNETTGNINLKTINNISLIGTGNISLSTSTGVIYLGTNGINISTIGEISPIYAGTGTATTISRSDHIHSNYVYTAGQGISLSVSNQITNTGVLTISSYNKVSSAFGDVILKTINNESLIGSSNITITLNTLTGSLPISSISATNISSTSFLCGNGSWIDIFNSPIEITKSVKEKIFNGNISSSSYTIDLNNGSIFDLTFIIGNSNCNLIFPSNNSGSQFTLIINQGSTGNNIIQWPTNVIWSNSIIPTLSSKTDVFTFFSDGILWFGFVGGLNFSRPLPALYL